MKLKRYQSETLSMLRRFFEEARLVGPEKAYQAITQDPAQASRLGRYAGPYRPLEELPQTPYICLRLPTGGGKTILGAYSIGVARDTWIEKDYPLVLWLVHTKTIKEQTVDAFGKPRHPYRQVLDELFDGRVRVFDIADFTQIRPHDIANNLCLVVGTIQSLRVNDTEGRRVYAHHEDLEPHFTHLSSSNQGLETLEDGRVKFSFTNLLHLHRPLMIVDEAHNAVTGLTREMQRRVNPCAIIEFTATPRPNSNILHNVSAQELKNEEMIKLPIVLSEHDTWQNAVNSAIAARAMLAEKAKMDPDYIRPIVLFQAQPKNQEVTVDVLKKHLIEVEHVPEEQIAVVTGDQRELDNIDVFDPKCPINYVITVEALKEGWDCSFAYVFCSVSRIRSATDVEQLLGRVLRMPYAKKREIPELNKAYSFVSEPSFGEAARALADKLVAMGFEEEEVDDHIEHVQMRLDGDGSLFDFEAGKPLIFTHTLTATPEVIEILNESASDRLTVREVEKGKIEISIVGNIDDQLERAIVEAIDVAEREAFTRALSRYREEIKRETSPADRGETLSVPPLMTFIQGKLHLADTDVLMEFHDWSILDYSPLLSEEEFAIRETARTFEIDLDGKRITYQFSSETESLPFDIDVEGWTEESLVLWLDRQVRQPDIPQSHLLRWLSDMVRHLTTGRGIPMSALMRCKYILARKVEEKIAAIRRKEREKAYQKALFAPGSNVELSFEASDAFTFKVGMYAGERRYRGHWKPSKHFLGPDKVPAFDGVKDKDGEEVQCAQAIDSLPSVKYWIRNVARHPQSFWLPTSTDRFYPDFVALLNDGRLLVVEYKGAHIADGPDTQEKRTIGRLWEARSNGKCLFLVVEKEVDGKNMRAQLLEKIGDQPDSARSV